MRDLLRRIADAINRFFRRIGDWFSDKALEFAVGLFISIFVLIYFAPSIFHTIDPGFVGVHWRRFGGGTQTVPGSQFEEGMAVIWPWDRLYLYDARLQQVERDFDVLSSDGLKITVNIAFRYEINKDYVGVLHKYAGPAYLDVMLSPDVGARARDIISRYNPEEIYTERRVGIQQEIRDAVDTNLKLNFNPIESEFKAPKPGTVQPTGPIQFLKMEDVLLRGMKLPQGVEEAIIRKNEQFHLNQEYNFRLLREAKESERKRIEAAGIRQFQDIVSPGLSDSYLKWRGIEATLDLARSNNAKIVVIGAGSSGMPLILGGTDFSKVEKVETTSAPAESLPSTRRNMKPQDTVPPNAAVAPAPNAAVAPAPNAEVAPAPNASVAPVLK